MNKVLVVEDSSFQRKAIVKVLHDMGLDHDVAVNGLDGLEKINSDSVYSFILTDLLMPELDGIGLIKKLNEQEYSKPIIVLTADIQKPVIDELKQLGVKKIIHKPFEEEDLKSILGEVLDGAA